MSQFDPLFLAMSASPGDDTLKLIYADRLEESGDPDAVARAELIRRERPISHLSRVGQQWWRDVRRHCFPFAPLHRLWAMSDDSRGIRDVVDGGTVWAAGGETYLDVNCGFVTGLGCELRHFRKYAARWFALNPIGWVTVWRFQWPTDVVAKTYESGYWDRNYYRSWWSVDGPSSAYSTALPRDIYDRLAGWDKEITYPPGGNVRHRCYHTSADATRALSDAWVDAGREAAGLPALPRKAKSVEVVAC